MQVSANSIQYNYAQLQALLSQTESPFGAAAAGTGQDVPGGSADSTSLTGAASTSAQPASGATPASQFSSDMLSSLISLQQVEPSPIAQASQTVISSLDANGDGALSLSEFEQALSGTSAGGAGASTSTTGAAASSTNPNASLAAIFNQLDSNGDGELDPTELTKAVQTAVDQAQQAGGGGRHHHHHHHTQTADSSSATTTTDPLTSTTASSTSTSSTATTGTSTATTTDATGTSTTASLAAAILS